LQALPVGTGGIAAQFVSYNSDGVLSMFGRPVIAVEHMAALGTTGDILLADLSQVQAIEKGGVQAASSIHVKFDYDETCYRFVYRFDSQPLWNSALTPKSGSATQSPFVKLDAR
jgi:HK97 family phage major capsid protein